MPALNFALGHRMIGRAAKVFDIATVEPFGEVTGDVAGTVVGQQPWSIAWLGLIKAAGPQCQIKGGSDIFRTTKSDISNSDGSSKVAPRAESRIAGRSSS